MSFMSLLLADGNSQIYTARKGQKASLRRSHSRPSLRLGTLGLGFSNPRLEGLIVTLTINTYYVKLLAFNIKTQNASFKELFPDFFTHYYLHSLSFLLQGDSTIC